MKPLIFFLSGVLFGIGSYWLFFDASVEPSPKKSVSTYGSIFFSPERGPAKSERQPTNEDISLKETSSNPTADARPQMETSPAEVTKNTTVDPVTEPHFLDVVPKTLHPDANGFVHLRWAEVPHARLYKLLMFNNGGELIKSRVTPRTFAFSRDFPIKQGELEAHFEMALIAIGANGKESAISRDRRTVIFRSPELAKVPQIENIKIQD